MSKPSFSNLEITIIGSLIIGASALLGVLITQIAQKWRQYNMITGVLEALYQELNLVRAQLSSDLMKEAWTRYDDKKKFWNKFEDDKEKFWEEWKNSKDEDKAIFPFYFPVSVNFSIIYRSNVNLIGEIKNLDLRRELVWHYFFLQLLVESYERNNGLFEQYKKAEFEGEKELKDKFLYELYLLAPTLKDNYELFNGLVGGLMEILEKEIDRRKGRMVFIFGSDSEQPPILRSILQSSNPTT